MYKTVSKSYCNKISVQSVKVSGIKKHYKCPSSSPTGCEKKKKDMKKTKTLRRKGPEVYWNEEELCIGS